MPRRMRLSDRNVARLRAGDSEYTVWDTKVTGLGVRVRPSGHRTFIFLDNRNGSSRRRTLGLVNLLRVDDARMKSRDLQSGGDAAAHEISRVVPVPLFRDFVEGPWRTECLARLKPSTRLVAAGALNNQLLPVFGAVPLDRIRRRDVNQWFDRYSATAPGGANRTLNFLCQIMNHAKSHGHIDSNPAGGIRRNPGRRFDRFLSREEMVRMHEELDRAVAEKPSRAPQADIIRLLTCTGCRQGEIRTLKWQEVGTDMLNLGDSKIGPRTVYLNSRARELIERRPRSGPYVFASPGDPMRPVTKSSSARFWYLVRRRAGIEDVRLHDLRHNFASHAVMQGVPLPTVARLLGHRNVSMTLRYVHVADSDVEAAAERIGMVIATICRSRTA